MIRLIILILMHKLSPYILEFCIDTEVLLLTDIYKEITSQVKILINSILTLI